MEIPNNGFEVTEALAHLGRGTACSKGQKGSAIKAQETVARKDINIVSLCKALNWTASLVTPSTVLADLLYLGFSVVSPNMELVKGRAIF